MVRGPTEYVPSVQVEVVSTRTAMPPNDNADTSMVRDSIPGQVRAAPPPFCGSARLAFLWAKRLSYDGAWNIYPILLLTCAWYEPTQPDLASDVW
jgi:hypothetical protein